MLAYGALSALLGLTNKRYLVVGVVYGFIVEAGIGLIPTNINNISISRHLRTLLANHPAVRDLYSWVPDGTSFSALMLLAGTVLFVAAGATLFTLREYHPADEMQK